MHTYIVDKLLSSPQIVLNIIVPRSELLKLDFRDSILLQMIKDNEGEES